MKTLEITKEKVLEAAAKCSTAKATLQVLFPEAFETQAHDFGQELKITTSCESPLYIGDGLAPHGLSRKCLIVNEDYKMEVKTYAGNKILIFTKK